VNAALGRRVLNHLTWHPGQLDMSGWAWHDRERGTIASMAGWALLLSGYTLPQRGQYQRADGTAVRALVEAAEANCGPALQAAS
jgi:hypothetical protein